MDLGYEEWLEKAGLEDTKENKDWYDCPEEDRADHIENNPEWWEDF